MNLQDAIRSGKPFRRPTWTHGDWLEVRKNPKTNPYGGGEICWYVQGDTIKALYYINDLLAEDWIVKEGEDGK